MGNHANDWESFSNRTVSFLAARRTVRKFRAVEYERIDSDLRKAVAAGQRASTSSWIQAFSVIHIKDNELRKELLEIPGLNQSQNHECSALLLFCADARRHMIISNAAGEPYTPNMETFLVSAIDASLFTERMVAVLEAMGYGICYCGAVRETIPEIDAKLSLPIGVFPLYAMAVGIPEGTHPSEWSPSDDSLRPRLPVDAVLMTDSYIDDTAMKSLIIAHDESAAEYYQTRSSVGAPKLKIRTSTDDANSDGKQIKRTWSGADFAAARRHEGSEIWKSMLDKFGGPKRTHLLSFYTSKGANFEPVSQALPLGRGGIRRIRGYHCNVEGKPLDNAYMQMLREKLANAIAETNTQSLLMTAAKSASASINMIFSSCAVLSSGKVGLDEKSKSVVISLDAAHKEVLDAFDTAPSIQAFFEETFLSFNPNIDIEFSLECDVAVPRGMYM